MNKYELAKLFGDVDDKFIEGAKPEAQQAVHLTIKKRSPLKMAIAASCAAAVLVGGIITVNALRSGNGGLFALSSGSGTVSQVNESSDISDNASEPSASDVSQEKTGNWFNDAQIYYEGEYYMVPYFVSPCAKGARENGLQVTPLFGIRKSSENTVDVVTLLRNNSYEPAGIRSYGPDSIAEVYCVPKDDDPYSSGSSGDLMTEKPLSVILEPGEVIYQKTSFKVGLGEYVVGIKYAYDSVDPEKGYGSSPHFRDDVDITEDGVQDTLKPEDLIDDDAYYEVPEFKGKLFSDAVQHFKNEGIEYYIVSRLDDTVPKDCVINAFAPVDPKDEHDKEAFIIVSLGSRNVGSTVSDPNENTTSDNSEPGEESKTISEWAEKPLVLPSEFAPEDLDFIHTGDNFPGSHTTTIEADRGSEVYAVDDGEVLFAVYDNNWNNGYGNHVVIKHAENLYTIYSHMLSAEESGNIVSAGDKVKAGQCIGLAGTSGNMRVYGLGYSFCTELPRFFKEEPLEVPDFTNQPWSYVIQQLANEGFMTSTISRTDNTIPRDHVIETNPPAHSMVDKGSVIVVVVSMGQSYSVDGESEFKGKPWSEVVQQLEKEGFKHTTKFQTDDTIPRDCVIGTSPSAPSTADKDTKIVIVVSLGSDYDKISDGEHSELDLSADLDGDGVPDALEAINPDKTDEDWELWKELEAIAKQREKEQQGNG